MKHKYLILSIPTIIYILEGIYDAINGNYSACIAWCFCAVNFFCMGLVLYFLRDELQEQDAMIEDLINRVLKLLNIMEQKDENSATE